MDATKGTKFELDNFDNWRFKLFFLECALWSKVSFGWTQKTKTGQVAKTFWLWKQHCNPWSNWGSWTFKCCNNYNKISLVKLLYVLCYIVDAKPFVTL
jgi:hypothetical protein